MSEGEYSETRRVVYGEGELEGMTFVPVCDKCSRFVKPDRTVSVDYQGQPKDPNAMCSRCGPTYMLFEGYY